MFLASKPWYMTAQQYDRHSIVKCTRCDEELTGHAIRMLELDQRTQTYHDFQDVPEDRSQGWHPFGLKCAKTLRRQALAERCRSAQGARIVLEQIYIGVDAYLAVK